MITVYIVSASLWRCTTSSWPSSWDVTSTAMLCESRRSRRPRSGSAGTGTGHRDGVGTTTIRGRRSPPISRFRRTWMCSQKTTATSWVLNATGAGWIPIFCMPKKWRISIRPWRRWAIGAWKCCAFSSTPFLAITKTPRVSLWISLSQITWVRPIKPKSWTSSMIWWSGHTTMVWSWPLPCMTDIRWGVMLAMAIKKSWDCFVPQRTTRNVDPCTLLASSTKTTKQPQQKIPQLFWLVLSSQTNSKRMP